MAERIDLEAIKAAADFAMVLENYGIALPGTLKDQIKVRCPWHDDQRPSLSINLQTKVFRCFGCPAKGNIFHFVVRMDEGVADTRAAGKKVAELCGVDPSGENNAARPSNLPAESQNRKSGVERRKSNDGPPGASERRFDARNSGEQEKFNKPLSFSLQNLETDHPYFEERGVSTAAIEAFGLGWCNPETTRSRLFPGWCVIPLNNEHGDLIGYAGRWPGDEPPDDDEKYKLPPNFHKNLVLYGLDKVVEPSGIPKTVHSLVIVEGYFSVFRLWELGIPVVALMGSSISDEQVDLLAYLPELEHVFVLMDGDDAGDRAVEQIVPKLAKRYFVKSPRLPDGEQPDTVDERILMSLVDDAL